MMGYKEEDYLMLSGIQHFAFCRRQWALIHIEKQWQENVRTIEGHLIHEKAHDQFFNETRGNTIISRGMPIYSASLGISGECDVIEFRKGKTGINIFGKEGLYEVIPIEYKRGKEKEDEIDELQLTAQAMCLEEMLCCHITKGYLYYNETRRRTEVVLRDQLRRQVESIVGEMHQLLERGHTPKVKRSKHCNACSLRDLCLPSLYSNKTAREYMERIYSEEEG
jgi:CRISPR-associated exonuclease Cas4